MDLIEWIPMFIRIMQAYPPKHVITADEYNNLFNLLITQGDHNTEAIANLRAEFPDTIGPAGPAGADGVDGAEGPQGPQGIPGINGVDGSGDLGFAAELLIYGNIINRILQDLPEGRSVYDGFNMYATSFFGEDFVSDLDGWVVQLGGGIKAIQPASINTNYDYAKHNIDYGDPGHYTDGSWSIIDSGTDVGNRSVTGYTQLFGPDGAGEYTGGGWVNHSVTEMSGNGTYMAYNSVSGNTAQRTTITKHSEIDDQVDYVVELKTSQYVEATADSIGSFITTVSAPNGTYPVNGIQSGYWWVKGSLSASGYAPIIMSLILDFGSLMLPATRLFALGYIETSDDTEATMSVSMDNGIHWTVLEEGFTTLEYADVNQVLFKVDAMLPGIADEYALLDRLGLVFLP